MTPTLLGRIQTRWFLLGTVGFVWTVVITPWLPGMAAPAEAYRITFTALALVAVVGLAWEFVYHALQQIRWEKDWPALFGLLNGVNEAVTTWLVLDVLIAEMVPPAAFIVHFTTTWLLVWLAANGPMRVLLLRWRFEGGRIV